MRKKFIYKKIFEITFILFGAMFVFFTVCGIALAAPNVDITYKAPGSATAGNTVNVSIDVAGDTALTTLGLRLNYDKSKLQYESGQWAPELRDSNSSMTLISDVEYNGGQVLNISMISESGYQNNGTMVTLTFSVKESYTDNPFRLELREITDKNTQSVAGDTSIAFQDTNNGSGSSGDGSENDSPGGGSEPSGGGNESSGGGNESPSGGNESSSSGSESSDGGSESTGGGTDQNGNTADSGNDGAGISGSEIKPTSGGAASTENVPATARALTGTDGSGTANTGNPRTFQTGIDVHGAKVFLLGGVFGLAGIICFVIRRKLSE